MKISINVFLISHENCKNNNDINNSNNNDESSNINNTIDDYDNNSNNNNIYAILSFLSAILYGELIALKIAIMVILPCTYYSSESNGAI